MWWTSRLLPLLAVSLVFAQSDSETITDSLLTLAGSITTTINEATVPTGTYLTYSSTVIIVTEDGTVTGSTIVSGTETSVHVSTQTNNATTSTTSTDTGMTLVGGQVSSASVNSTSNATSTAPPAASSSSVVNTTPCNGYAEFCNRKYSNITMVAAHNSPFHLKGNVASNQALNVQYQLEDGVRMLQFQTHLQNGTMYLCHSTCDLLNAGPLEDYLTAVTSWIKANPYDVVTILIGNYDYVDPSNFTVPIENSGLMDFVYTPPRIPMSLNNWPTLGELIISGKRALVFMDYQANQTAYPWLMDEFSQMWETPFSPTDPSFPCTQQRPPGLSRQDAKNRLYMANHNLNLNIDIANINLLIPNTAALNETNAVTGPGSLGWMAGNCTESWGRPPNFLLVDYYNEGSFNGSVFEVAAQMNNVTYDRSSCCGTLSAASTLLPGQSVVRVLLLLVAVQFVTSIL